MSLSTGLILFTASGALLFVILYATISPFYKNITGWNMMAFMVVVAAMVVQALTFRMTGIRLPEWVISLDWAAAGSCVWWRVGILLYVQKYRPNASYCPHCGKRLK